MRLPKVVVVAVGVWRRVKSRVPANHTLKAYTGSRVEVARAGMACGAVRVGVCWVGRRRGRSSKVGGSGRLWSWQGGVGWRAERQFLRRPRASRRRGRCGGVSDIAFASVLALRVSVALSSALSACIADGVGADEVSLAGGGV